ncbi:uncharacterized protein L969DRAFT_531382 [Mixia osmundae IAM 14324]|uniref:Uncharacterized protein n=1 Tax=Mixia osmundae (strain CBS 9802 / IAM 14324 / JCM 22182 / KY 12970) TaxID=764103 RepID=G7E7H0_MIXOS|nr:uncharacterized protein L969DRAFT_531382 [Mixia osmundae IAM 14324]KEI38383.1 hypothetical protein L969DRAFT_531382 [Mixia osmundae IAM 14324]GAA98780.1 hypothetical protein E5Q_05468 [Mixia osmundae IAM 14324]
MSRTLAKQTSALRRLSTLHEQQIAPAAMAMKLVQQQRQARQVQQKRSASTQALSQEENLQMLNKQRVARPTSPHFTIYEPQLTWLSSIANRVTGSALSGGFYAFALAYIALPAVGMPFDSASLVEIVHSLPEWAKIAGKFTIGIPFWFHNFNGLRHLSWDMGFVLGLKESYVAGYSVIGATVLASIGTAMI